MEISYFKSKAFTTKKSYNDLRQIYIMPEPNSKLAHDKNYI